MGSIVLLSGGLDSATCLVMALEKSPPSSITALSFDYGQRHNTELAAARNLVSHYKIGRHTVVPLSFGSVIGSSLTDSSMPLPVSRVAGSESDGSNSADRNSADSNSADSEPAGGEIPTTYVPARNITFLAIAAGLAERFDCPDIYIGVNAVDYSGYPDCRPEFIKAFQEAVRLGTRRSDITIHTPLIDMTKAAIIETGHRLGLDYSLTVSCYQADEEGRACGVCDSCIIRQKGFREAKIEDVTRYCD